MPQVTLVRNQHDLAVMKRVVAGVAGIIVLAVLVVVIVSLVASQKYNHVIRQEAQLDAAKNYSAETTLLANYINSNPPKRYQYQILVRLGDLTYNAGHFAAAAGWYFRAYELTSKPTVSLVVQLARSSAQIGDKATAISYWRKAIVLTPANDPVDKTEYQNEIRFLGGTP